MKKLLLSAACAAAATAAHSQVIADSVYLGASYANNVWYSLENDSVTASAKNNWNLAFETAVMPGVAIYLNTAAGDRLYVYPKSDTSGWSAIDTTGLSTWKALWNSDKTWSSGAFNHDSSGFNVGWGIYDINTHIITGDSIYIVRLGAGGYKKLLIQDMAAGAFHFKYADLNGANEMNMTGTKANYATKNLFYFSMVTNTFIDREPASASWDLWFGQYSDSITTSQGNPSPVTGVLTNTGVMVAKAYPVADKGTYTNYAAHAFSSPINTIGYDWKPFSNGVYTIKDSTVYFIRTRQGAIWKLLFTGFGGSANGKIAFTKEKLVGVSVPVVNGNTAATVAVYPNPAQGSNTTLVYSFEQVMNGASVVVTDMAGRSLYTAALDQSAGLHQHILPTATLPSGLYTVTVNTTAGRVQQKLVVRN